MRFRQGRSNFTPPPPPSQKKCLQSPPRLGLSGNPTKPSNKLKHIKHFKHIKHWMVVVFFINIGDRSNKHKQTLTW